MVANYTTHSVAETWQAAADVAARLPCGGVVALSGELGAGKTTFVQGLAHALGVQRQVTSPTFTLVGEYRGANRRQLVHMDLYRLQTPDDLLVIGFAEYLESGAVVAIEWPERAGDLLPADAVRVDLQTTDDPDVRLIRVTAATPSTSGPPARA
jgi:tRNA threonylcarbamoyladenosine biosynthesis protein TsaE